LAAPQGFEPRYADPESGPHRFAGVSRIAPIIPYLPVFSKPFSHLKRANENWEQDGRLPENYGKLHKMLPALLPGPDRFLGQILSGELPPSFSPRT
jgi:hypothetical protein